MPLRVYTTTERPLRLRHHICAHAWEIPLTIAGALIGAAVLVMTLLGRAPSSTLAKLPAALVVTLGALLIAGAIHIVIGLTDKSEDLMRGWIEERTGLVLFGTAWLIYSGAVLALSVGALVPAALGLGFFVACAVRLRATYQDEKDTRAATLPLAADDN